MDESAESFFCLIIHVLERLSFYDRTRITTIPAPRENARCEWKEFKNLKNSFCGDEKDDVISYVSAIANMEGGFLVVGVHDKSLEIVGTDTYNYGRQKAILRLTDRCANLSSEGLDIEEFITDDTKKKVWVISIPKHRPKLPVYAHDKAWQRIEDSLVELTSERLNAILEETSPTYDWSAETIIEATLDVNCTPKVFCLTFGVQFSVGTASCGFSSIGGWMF